MARIPAGVKRAELIELVDIAEQIKSLDRRKKELVDKAKRAHAHLGPDTYVYGPVVLLLKESRKFDLDGFAKAYPIEAHPSFYSPAIDRTLIPEQLRGQFVTLERSLEPKRAASATPVAAD